MATDTLLKIPLVVTDDLHPMVHTEPYSSWFQTLFQLVQGKICLISSDLVGSKLYSSWFRVRCV
jgi:hypothetical protein